MTNYPEFSVLMAVYYKDNPEFLKEAVDSVLQQTLPPAEIVIIKDGRLTDELEAVLSSYSAESRIKVFGYEDNRGLGLALNYGVEKCSCDIIARMDADDISREDRFEKEMEVLIGQQYDFVGSNTQEFTGTPQQIQSTRIMPEHPAEILEYSKTRNPFIHPSVMTYKSIILSCGNFQNVYLCEDYDMWVRILEKGYKAYNIQDFLVYMRVGKDFYKRRGGWKYCKAIVGFKRRLYKKGYMSFMAYQKTKFSTIIVSLMPGFLREFVYKKFLRG